MQEEIIVLKNPCPMCLREIAALSPEKMVFTYITLPPDQCPNYSGISAGNIAAPLYIGPQPHLTEDQLQEIMVQNFLRIFQSPQGVLLQ